MSRIILFNKEFIKNIGDNSVGTIVELPNGKIKIVTKVELYWDENPKIKMMDYTEFQLNNVLCETEYESCYGTLEEMCQFLGEINFENIITAFRKELESKLKEEK